MDIWLDRFLEGLQGLPPLWVEGLTGIVGVIGMFILHRFFGAVGLWVYASVAAIAANIQVLKCTQVPFLDHPLALGTILFSTIFLANDWLTERYGLKEARKGIALNLMVQLLFIVWMLLTVGVQPAAGQESVQGHFEALFVPQVRLLIAGLLAFGVGQWYDVLVYRRLKEQTHGRHLWLRAGLSYGIAVFLDNTVFSLLAWRFLAPHPMPWEVLIESYLIGIFLLRLILGGVNILILYGVIYKKIT
jgi:uncharacterized integral membrane protein (TIGR00697 family)